MVEAEGVEAEGEEGAAEEEEEEQSKDQARADGSKKIKKEPSLFHSLSFPERCATPCFKRGPPFIVPSRFPVVLFANTRVVFSLFSLCHDKNQYVEKKEE